MGQSVLKPRTGWPFTCANKVDYIPSFINTRRNFGVTVLQLPVASWHESAQRFTQVVRDFESESVLLGRGQLNELSFQKFKAVQREIQEQASALREIRQETHRLDLIPRAFHGLTEGRCKSEVTYLQRRS